MTLILGVMVHFIQRCFRCGWNQNCNWTFVNLTQTRYIINDADRSVMSLAGSIREILLQEKTDMQRIIAELVVSICNEITCGTSTDSRSYAYMFIRWISAVPSARQELERLGRVGGLLEKLAKDTFEKLIFYINLPIAGLTLKIQSHRRPFGACLCSLVLCGIRQQSRWVSDLYPWVQRVWSVTTLEIP